MFQEINLNSEDENTAPVEAPAWESTRTVWSAGGVDLPATMNSNNAHFLADLKGAAANFRSAKTVSDMDRERDWSFDELADRCRDLSDALSRMDTVASARIAGASPVSFTPLVGETIANLDVLEAAVKHAQVPLIPRRKPHEHNNFLVVVLADIFERSTDRKASVTTNPVTDNREGPFVDFVMSFAEHFLPDEVKALNPRAIQRALKMRKDNPEEDRGR